MKKEIEYLKEHLYEIYKYKKSMQDLTYDMDLEHLLRTCKALDYSQNEIERLNKALLDIKEKLKDYGDRQDIVDYTMYYISGEQLINILDIVNKAIGDDK